MLYTDKNAWPDWCTQDDSTALPMQGVPEAVAGTNMKVRCERRLPSGGTAGQPDLVPPGVAGCPNPELASRPVDTAQKMAHVVYQVGIWILKPDVATVSVHTV